MVTLLELLRQNRGVSALKLQTAPQQQKTAQSAQKAVNVQAKGFFDAIPKPSDIFLFGRQKQAQQDLKPTATVSAPKPKTITTRQTASIQSFLKKGTSISSVFKSFGF